MSLTSSPHITPSTSLADTSVSWTRPRPPAAGSATGSASDSLVPATRPRPSEPITDRLEAVIDRLATSQYELVMLAAEFADSPDWIVTGSPTPAHWLAAIADIEVCTAREWIRIGRCLQCLPLTTEALRMRHISYSKARALTRLATPENESELLEIAERHTAGQLGRALASWLTRNSEPEDLAEHQHRQRSVKWRVEPSGMTTFTLRLPPLLAGLLISFLTTWIMTTRPRTNSHSDDYPSVAQQHADGIEHLLTEGAGGIDTELVVHVRGDGNTLDDGTPVPDSTVASLIPQSFIRALIHDSAGRPIDATNRRRHPTRRQRRLVNEQQPTCIDCGDTQLLQYDHVPEYATTGHTVTTELVRRCAPCHTRRSCTVKDRKR